MRITIDDIITVPLGRKAKFGTLDVDMTKFPKHVIDYLMAYGVRQSLNDAMADKSDKDGNDLTDAEIVAKAERRLANLYAGLLRQRTYDKDEPLDPFEAECWRIAWDDLARHFGFAGRVSKDRIVTKANNMLEAEGKGPIDQSKLYTSYMAVSGDSVRSRAMESLNTQSVIDITKLLSQA